MIPDNLLDKVHCTDALALMAQLPDNSVGMILTDIPYGVHEAEWDKSPELSAMWAAFKRVIKPRHAIVMTATMRLAVELITTSDGWFKYDWVANKTIATDFLNAPNKPMRSHEHVLVFSDGTTANKSPNRMVYYPQMSTAAYYRKFNRAGSKSKSHFGAKGRKWAEVDYVRESMERYPQTSLFWDSDNNGKKHPNQKPLDAWMYLVLTYTQPNDIILDPFVGSGTTAVAAATLNRRFIAGDISEEYCAIARKRLETVTPNMFEVYSGFQDMNKA